MKNTGITPYQVQSGEEDSKVIGALNRPASLPMKRGEIATAARLLEDNLTRSAR